MRLTADGVTVRYGGHLVLDSVSLEVGPGESVAITGPSGSGKTTLLAVLGLLIRPDRGRVELDGVRATPRVRRQFVIEGALAWVFQTTNCLGSRTVLENVALPLLARGFTMADTAEQVHNALGTVGLAGFEDRRANTLSGGELQRVCIARATVVRPRLVFADEPTGQLDYGNTVAVLDALHAARPKDGALLVASHDPVVVGSCERRIDLQDCVVQSWACGG